MQEFATKILRISLRSRVLRGVAESEPVNAVTVVYCRLTSVLTLDKIQDAGASLSQVDWVPGRKRKYLLGSNAFDATAQFASNTNV